LLDLVAGRSAAAMTSWLAERDRSFRERVEVVAMDGFGGYKTAARKQGQRGVCRRQRPELASLLTQRGDASH
jgi:transposase